MRTLILTVLSCLVLLLNLAAWAYRHPTALALPPSAETARINELETRIRFLEENAQAATARGRRSVAEQQSRPAPLVEAVNGVRIPY